MELGAVLQRGCVAGAGVSGCGVGMVDEGGVLEVVLWVLQHTYAVSKSSLKLINVTSGK